jgi:hypothetical protein
MYNLSWQPALVGNGVLEEIIEGHYCQVQVDIGRFSVPTIVEEILILQGLESSAAQESSTSIDMTHGVHGGVLDCRNLI